MTDKNDPPPYLDDLTCQEPYAELVQVLFGGHDSLLRIEFCAPRWTANAPLRVRCIVPVSRVALTLPAAAVLRDQLNNCFDLLEKRSALQEAQGAVKTKQ